MLELRKEMNTETFVILIWAQKTPNFLVPENENNDKTCSKVGYLLHIS